MGKFQLKGVSAAKEIRAWFGRSRKNPGPLINALHAWLTDGPPAPPITESWLLAVPGTS